VVINGSSSGSATIAVSAAAGTPTLTLPTSSGTLSTTAYADSAASSAAASAVSDRATVSYVNSTVASSIAAAPTAYSVGSYTLGSVLISNYRGTLALGNNGNYSSGITENFLVNAYQQSFDGNHLILYYEADYLGNAPPFLSGTWKWMCTNTPAYGGSGTNSSVGLFCRVA
jgi:hypothetical protein